MKEERYIIAGKATPYRADNPTTSLAEISIGTESLEVILTSGSLGPWRCCCKIWDHTVYELEILSLAVRCSAEKEFPPRLEVPSPESQFGTEKELRLSVSMEVGYSLGEPGADRVTFICYSRDWGFLEHSLGVLIGVALSGGYGEVVITPLEAVEFADWLDHQIARICG